MSIISNPLAERRMIEGFLPETEQSIQEFTDSPPFLPSPVKRKTRKIKAVVKPVQQILAKLAESQGFVPEDHERVSPALPGPTGPMSSVDAMTQMRKTKDTADTKLTQSLQRQAIPQQLLQVLGAFAGRQPYRPNPAQQKAPWPPPANAPTRKMTPEVRPEMPSPSPQMNIPSSGASITPPSVSKPARPKFESKTPQPLKDAAEFLKMKQYEKFINDSNKKSNPMIDMLVQAGRNVVTRKSGQKAAPLRKGSLGPPRKPVKRDWMTPFDGPMEDY